jgi:glucose-6-phosphate isomerase
MNNAWTALMAHADAYKAKPLSVAQLFSENTNRFNRFSVQLGDLLFDYSKQKVTAETMRLLLDLAKTAQLKDKIEALFTGERLNVSEARSVLHTALRDSTIDPLWVEGQNIKSEIRAAQDKMENFVTAFQRKQKKGVTGLPLKHCVCLGIGGSGLGPSLVCEALAPYKTADVQVHFVSNIDGETLDRVLQSLPPEETFCLISSKTFSTLETRENAYKIKAWFKAAFGGDVDDNRLRAHHWGAITAAPEKAHEVGFSDANIFPFWPWVGGRFSVWSSVGLPIALFIGMKNFREFLSGAEAVDKHFRSAPFAENIPVLMALLGIWNINGLGYSTHAILPYADALKRFPSYCQQLEMESNGKGLNEQGQPVPHQTAPVIWGDVGCDGQHAYMQLLHQGTVVVPVDFLVPVRSRSGHQDLQTLLVANALSQSKALMEGQVDAKTPLKSCGGDRPSSTLMFSQLTPKMLGNLLSLYEHKVFVQGILWSVNSFDQWGVELGKQLTQQLLPKLINNAQQAIPDEQMDSSTTGLLAFFHRHQGGNWQYEGQSSTGNGRNRGNRNSNL